MRASLFALALLVIGSSALAQQLATAPTTVQQDRPQITIMQAEHPQLDAMDQALIERAKRCHATPHQVIATTCASNVMNIYATRAMFKITCIQAAAGADPANPQSEIAMAAYKQCSGIVTDLDGFVNQAFGIGTVPAAQTLRR